MVRRGWLERGPGPDPRRGQDEFVRVSWDEVIEHLANELRRVTDTHGLNSIFAGSYGWSSAGRFHHAQSQVHRSFNKALGGYVRSVYTYSAGAAEVILPYVLGPFERVARRTVTWDQIFAHTEVVLAFGGMALKYSQTASGGVSHHMERGAMRAAAERGCRFINVSALQADLPEEARPEWIAPVPGTDTALMLGLMHTLVSECWHDPAFIERYCSGWAGFEAYLLGSSDGIAKTPEWAAAICGIPAPDIVALARSLAGKRVLVVVSHSLQRAEFGEQPVWMGAALAALLGQNGLPGGGYYYALGTLSHYGRRNNLAAPAALDQGVNSVREYIPCARISDMLLNPGEQYDFNGQRLTYPRIKLAWWAGGNPFHHHQNPNRLAAALRTLDTFVVHESAWTTTARFADIVLPATLTLERENLGATPTDPVMVAMQRVLPPYEEARDDYDIFCALADKLGKRAEFSEGRSARDWVAFLYERTHAHGLATEGREPAGFRGILGTG